MLSIRKILVPVASAEPSLGHQAAWLARRFQAEMILLHVVPPLSYPVGMLESGHEITARDLHARIVRQAQEELDQALHGSLDGIAVTRVLLRGDPAAEIVRTAREHSVDLIVMATHHASAFYRFLLGSVTAKVLHEGHCAVWTGAHTEDHPAKEFSIRRVLCSVDLSAHSKDTLSSAARFAAAVDATLTLVHVTGSVEMFGPGGAYVDPAWKEKIVGFATAEIAKLQQDAGTKAEVVIESGNVPRMLNQAAVQTNADVLIIGHIPGQSHLGDNSNGYGIVRDSRIPVLSL